MLETIYSCGLRAQETANLNWRDIDFRASFIRVNNGKGGKDRIVPIGEKALVALWYYGKADHKLEPAGLNPVFPSRRRQRITTRNIQRMTKMSTHSLRHSFATHCMQNGMKISELGECLGHASLSTTQKYIHIPMKEAIDNYDTAHPRA
jgi:integrase/recombinase XerC